MEMECRSFFSFFFNDTATTEIYTLSLHDALPIWRGPAGPLLRAHVLALSTADHHQRRAGELVAQGSHGTAVCAVPRRLPRRGRRPRGGVRAHAAGVEAAGRAAVLHQFLER